MELQLEEALEFNNQPTDTRNLNELTINAWTIADKWVICTNSVIAGAAIRGKI